MGDVSAWRTAFRLGRAGLRMDSKHVGTGWVTVWYRHPAGNLTATFTARASEVGR